MISMSGGGGRTTPGPVYCRPGLGMSDVSPPTAMHGRLCHQWHSRHFSKSKSLFVDRFQWASQGRHRETCK